MKKTIILIFTIAAFLMSCEKPDRGTLSDSRKTSEAPDNPIVLDSSGHKEKKPAEESTDDGAINIPTPEKGQEDEIPPRTEEPDSFEGYILQESDVSENGVYLKSVRDPGRVVIDFAGDINFDDHYAIMNALRSRGGAISSCIDPALIKRTNDADIFLINNEFPYSNRGTPLPDKKFTFRARPETVTYLNDLGADIANLANNHAFDHGADALLDTFDTLKGAGIPYVGAGHDLEEAMRPVYFIAGGMKIAFVAATQIERSLPPDTKEATETDPGVLRTLDPGKFLTVIENARENSDFVIVFVHWGSENVNTYEAAQTELAAKYKEAGADLIIGAHPHVLQGITYVGEVPVVNSLGNYWFSSKKLDNCLVEAVIKDKKLESLQFIPCMQRDCSTRMLEKDSADYLRILEEMRNWSTGDVAIDDLGYISKK